MKLKECAYCNKQTKILWQVELISNELNSSMTTNPVCVPCFTERMVNGISIKKSHKKIYEEVMPNVQVKNNKKGK